MKQLFGQPAWRYYTPAILLGLDIAYLAIALGLPGDAGLMPVLVGAALLILLPIDLISLSDTRAGGWLRRKANPVAGEDIEQLGPFHRQLTSLAWVMAFGAAMFLVGILAAVPLYIAGSLRYLGKKSWKECLLTAIIVGLCTYLLFEWALGVELYPGVFLARY